MPRCVELARLAVVILAIASLPAKTVIEVTEAGTEAAAATIVGGEIGSAAPDPADEPVVFALDHPFFFVIADSETGAFVFMGRVTDPLQGD
jgi:serpin B